MKVVAALLTFVLLLPACEVWFHPTYENLYAYCLTDPDVRSRARRSDTPVETYCDSLLRRSGYEPKGESQHESGVEKPNENGCSDGSCRLRRNE